MNSLSTYSRLSHYLIESSVLSSTASLLSWDELVYMPPKAADGRAKQLSLLARMVHERFITPQVTEQIAELAGQPLDADAASNVREWKRNHERAIKIPPALIEEMSSTAVHSREAWGEARKTSDFAHFKPWLTKTIELQRQLATCLCGHAPTSVEELYDSLLDAFEPHETTAHLRSVFGELRPRLTGLIHKVAGSSRKAPADLLKRKYPLAKQRTLAERAAKLIGYDLQAGRVDTTTHPFCSGIGPGDTRITTRFDENDFGNCFFSVLHETGHALYDQGLPAEHWGTPLGEAVSLGVHESQSRLWENLVGRSEPFWRFFFPQTKKAFAKVLGDVALDDWLFAINAIQPSLIRTEADEASYNLHVLLRFELELLLLSGELPVDDLPAEWNRRMEQYLGVKVPSDREGCLQDVHWSQGAFGYFPTYTLGNLNAANLFAKARQDLGDLDGQIEQGKFRPLLEWLRANVHQHGQRYPARELMKRATGQELSIEPLMEHLEAKAERYYGT